MDGDHPAQKSGPRSNGELTQASVYDETGGSHQGFRCEEDALGTLLLQRGSISAKQLAEAKSIYHRTSLSLGQVLTTRDIITETELLSALAEVHSVGIIDLAGSPPSVGLSSLMPARVAISCEAIIWRRSGSALVVATTRPDRIAEIQTHLPVTQRVIAALATRAQIMDAQRSVYGPTLARLAEGRAPEHGSARRWRGGAVARWILLGALISLATALVAPLVFAQALFGLAIAVFIANCMLKAISLGQSLRYPLEVHGAPDAAMAKAAFLDAPTVTVLVPLLGEREVAGALVDRLRRLDYPRERLDVILAVEEDDPLTLSALRTGTLPPWMRAVIVPRGTPQTKPRALNYALNFARGTIVGIYDAEDRPDPDQIKRVVARFAELPPHVACLQGRLDYYNARHNWLSRLFTIEYAAWFRVILPGVQQLGLVVPLGGTTVFLRRGVLEEVGAWDAHNVTEDAELGLRLARAGYETQLVDTTTYEEANAALVPWVKQRSRWLKGYLMTWGSAMRDPVGLWRDLGAWRFCWLQVQLIGAVLGFLTAPLLWTFMFKPFGVWHPLDAVVSPFGFGLLGVAMVTGLLISIGVSYYACRAAHLKHLRPVSPLVEPYYLFGTIAAWIGVYELVAKPFFWAKTRHGSFGGEKDTTPP